MSHRVYPKLSSKYASNLVHAIHQCTQVHKNGTHRCTQVHKKDNADIGPKVTSNWRITLICELEFIWDRSPCQVSGHAYRLECVPCLGESVNSLQSRT